MQQPPPTTTPLPLFPLGTVLFPGGFMPLRIFEVRYLDLINKCYRSGEPFGVVSLTQGSEVLRAGAQTERFAEVGTVARIRSFDSPQAGLLQIECVGAQRFRIHSSAQQQYGLWMAQAETIEDDVALAVPDDLRHAAVALQRLVDTLAERRSMQAMHDMGLPIYKPYRFDDCGWVANRWCEFLPIQTQAKQRLLELDSPLMRLELVSDLLAHTGIAE
ncbi:LON peptidase substrate-binding domain-containing protein [Variovorax sp. dw_954]|uniref:LON peptidase substrate-binding domain-containing protein n=1 Tax=Variovorax sp. dw_954 TaxID=2720078 RepID=UPI001BD3CD93|nr:LON peptidase substrate-binding domain-containing protein [Variovorax sp. dw_954]